jgi:hypothetical protein
MREESLRSVSYLADSSIAAYTGVPGLPGSANPNAGKQYTFVKITGVWTVGLAVAKAADLAVGVLQNKPQQAGQAATVGIRGISTVVAGAALTTPGTPVTADASGRAIAATGADKVYGITVSIAAAADHLLSVQLTV